jgi:hypothetical protein
MAPKKCPRCLGLHAARADCLIPPSPAYAWGYLDLDTEQWVLVCPCLGIEEAQLVQKYLWFFLDLLCAGAADAPPPTNSGHPTNGLTRVYRLSPELLVDAQMWKALEEEDGKHR